jgi:dTDP-glucose 4,6-dehydratase
MSARKILVTGADGFIGSHLTEELVRSGHAVRAMVFYNSFNSWGWLDHSERALRDALEVVTADIRDAHGMRRAVEGCDAVMHLAALIAIPFSYVAPDSYVETNVRGTLNLLQAARDAGVSHFIHTSTSEVYGTARFVPITEEHPLQAQSPYAATKIGADQMALAWHQSFGLPVTVVRPFNTYGPRQSARAVIPTIVTQIASGARVVKLGATRPTRDFNYVADTVRGFIAALESDRAVGQVVNLGSSFEISIGETARLIAEVMRSDVRIEQDQSRVRPAASEVERLWAANTRARELLGWRPEYAGLEGMRRGLEQTIQWFVEPDNLRRYKPDIYNV